MALKECPSCKQFMNVSAKRCRCGHEFDPATLVKKTTPRCPLCGQLAEAGAGACDCGHDFSTPPIDLRRQLVRRKRHGWFWIGAGVLVVLAVGGVWVLAIALPILPGVGVASTGAWMIARGIRSISWTRGELAELDAKALPAARVVERRSSDRSLS